MMRSEMEEDRLADRDLFVEKVRAAGWDVGGWEQLFEEGADLDPEAQAEYRNEHAFLRLSYHAKSDYVFLECGAAGPGGEPEGANVRFYPLNDVGALVDKVTAAQDTLTPETLSRLIEQVEPLCNYVMTETPEGLEFL